MAETFFLDLSPREAAEPDDIRRALSRRLGRSVGAGGYSIVHRAIDARQRRIKVHLGIRLHAPGDVRDAERQGFVYRDVHNAEPVLIVGAGPAGLFAALRLVEQGVKPIVIERGKPVHARRRDVAALNRRGVLLADSNYAFGEGGAGTFSDGKLYTRSKKRGDHRRVLHRLHQHGADERILYEGHPHIGSNRLPGIVGALRATIVAHGGECHFQKRVVGLTVAGGGVCGVELADGDRLDGRAVILATGHSARDVYAMLLDRRIALEAKPFAMGVRVEHPQRLIDAIQYRRPERGPYLPPAAYRLTAQVDGRGVYSFCMCPGGFIVPAATETDGVVVNGMSFAKRNSPYANAGIVVEVRPADLPGYTGADVLAGLAYQRLVERAALRHGGGGVVAPAQRLTDFVDSRSASDLPACSYPPGTTPSDLHAWLPPELRRRLQAGFQAFERKMMGFLTPSAVVVGVESRTSSPVRIPRDPVSLQHAGAPGLFPCGEGAGYAGGIVSCAVDGERVADAVARFLKQ